MAMIFIVLLTVLMLSFAVLGQTEAVIGGNHMRVAQARAQAESGFEHAVWALTQGILDPGSAYSLDNPLPDPRPAPYDGTFVPSGLTGGYRVNVANVSNTERLVRSQGCVPDCTDGTRRAHRLIEAVVERFPDFELDTPCALCVRGSLSISGNSNVSATTDLSCGNKKGTVTAGALTRSGNARVYGADANPNTPNEPTDYDQNVTDPTAFDGVTFGPKHFDKLRELAKINGTYFGPGHPNGTPATSPPWEGVVSFDAGNKLKDGIVFIDTVSGNDIPSDPNLQDPADLATVLISGNPFVSDEFQGWIIVNGSLAISGNMKIHGLVYTTNDFIYNGTGTGYIEGLVVSQNLVDSAGTTIGDDATSSGNSRIRFDCDATRNSAFVPQGFFLQTGTYRELEGELMDAL